MENTFDGPENECNDLDKVVEDINEITRLVWTQHIDSHYKMMILAIFDCNIDEKIIAVTLDEYPMLSCVDMNWFYEHFQ